MNEHSKTRGQLKEKGVFSPFPSLTTHRKSCSFLPPTSCELRRKEVLSDAQQYFCCWKSCHQRQRGALSSPINSTYSQKSVFLSLPLELVVFGYHVHRHSCCMRWISDKSNVWREKKKKKEKAAGEHHIRAKRTGEYIGQGKSQIRCGLMCLASCIKTEAIEGHLLCAFYVLSMPSSCCTHSRL